MQFKDVYAGAVEFHLGLSEDEVHLQIQDLENEGVVMYTNGFVTLV